MTLTGRCSQVTIIRVDPGVGHLWRLDRPQTMGSHHRPVIPAWDLIQSLCLCKPVFLSIDGVIILSPQVAVSIKQNLCTQLGYKTGSVSISQGRAGCWREVSAFEANKFGFKSWLCHLLACGSLGLSFYVNKTARMMLTTYGHKEFQRGKAKKYLARCKTQSQAF